MEQRRRRGRRDTQAVLIHMTRDLLAGRRVKTMHVADLYGIDRSTALRLMRRIQVTLGGIVIDCDGYWVRADAVPEGPISEN